MRHFKNTRKYVCCTLNVTIAARMIGFIGIMISVLLVTVLLNDKYFDKGENYDITRKTALAFGLDWQHLHSKASTAHHNDPEGKKITAIVLFYSGAFLLTNFLLCFATIQGDWKYAIPWMICEFLGCLSKFGALIYHLVYDRNNLSNIFICGSLIYIITMVWWWVVVFLAQLSWMRKEDSQLILELSDVSSRPMEVEETDFLASKTQLFQGSLKDSLIMDSPGTYTPNNMYALI